MRRWMFLVTMGLLVFSAAGGAQPAERPNILFVLADDLGWSDVGYQGGKAGIKTPNIDKLAGQGMVFTDAYAACPVCSPTRASVLTGKYPARLKLTSHIPSLGPKWDQGRPDGDVAFGLEHGVRTRNWLPLEEMTVGEAMQQLDYTTGFFGKWHLGHEPYHPIHQGFDVQVGVTNWGQPPSYHAPYKRDWPRNDSGVMQMTDLAEDAAADEYLTDRLTREASQFIRANKDGPWFCYMSYYTVHTPIQPPHDLAEKHSNDYTAMVASLDRSVGRLLDVLDDEGLTRRTIVVFTSDNGGMYGNKPLRANKGHTYEGGIRVPLVVRWPGVTEPGGRSDEPVTSTDFFPTFVEMAGGDRSLAAGAVDGVSLVPLLRGGDVLSREALYWHFPHRGGVRISGAIRRGRYKLIEQFERRRVLVYDLSQDIGERHDLSDRQPDMTRALYQQLQQWRRDIDAPMPPGYSSPTLR